MRAIQVQKYGGPEVLEVTDLPIPKPKENEILIKIKASAVTAASTAMRTGKPYFGRLFLGLNKPKISTPGTDLAGIVVEIGHQVSKFKVGDAVIAETGINCGAYAEYICLSEDELIVAQPINMSPEEATGMIDGACTALAFFTDQVKIQKGQKVLINGASGSIGTAAVQLAKQFGAEVTGVCSTKNIELVKSLGADFVIDYTKQDFTTLEKNYDVIFDTVGKLSFPKSKRAISPNGVFLTPVLSLSVLGQMLFSSLFGNKKLKFAATGIRELDLRMRDLKIIKEMAEAGTLKTILDRTYRLEQIQEAQVYVEKGHKVGNVVILMEA